MGIAHWLSRRPTNDGNRRESCPAIPMKWLQDSLTGKDNLTYDAARIVGVIGAAAYVFFWAAAVFNFGHFSATDAAAYGAGLATVLLSMSAAVRLKLITEPEAPPQS
jgi:hypothetical protein